MSDVQQCYFGVFAMLLSEVQGRQSSTIKFRTFKLSLLLLFFAILSVN